MYKLDRFAEKIIIWFVILSFCQAFQIDFHELDQRYERLIQSDVSQNWTSAQRDLPKDLSKTRRKRQNRIINRCNVPSGPEITYVIVDENSKQPISLSPGSKAPIYSRLEITCKNGYALLDKGRTTSEQRSFCHAEEGWVPPLSPCIKTCPTLKPVNMDLTCFHGNSRERMPCYQSMVSDIIVEPTCKPFHVADRKIDYREMKCQKNGEWDQDLYKCVPACGKVNELNTFIVDGKKTTVDESPWNVAVYRTSKNNYTLICGGTIVSPLIILSAAHCFYNNREKKSFNATNFEIFVGKYSRDYKTNDIFQKKLQIRSLKIHENFNPNESGHYGFDIAVVVLEEPIALSKYSLPACIDWAAPYGFKPGEGTPGKLSGWGIINNTNFGGTPSPYLLTKTLPFISYQNCFRKLILPNDQYCAGSDSGPGARKGDNGGGLLFYDNTEKSYFLRGIVSSGRFGGDWVEDTAIWPFTDISYHLTWLDKERQTVEKEQAAITNEDSPRSPT